MKTLPSVTGFSTFYVSTNNVRFILKLAIFVERKVGREFYILMIQVAQIKTQAFMYFLCLLRWIQRQGGLEKYGRGGGGCRNRDRGGWVGKNMAVVVVLEIETEEGGSDGLLSVTGGDR